MNGVASRRQRAQQLHKEVSIDRLYRNLIEFVEEDPALLWEPIRAGYTLVHLSAWCLRREQLIGISTTNPYALTTADVPSPGSSPQTTDLWAFILRHACLQHQNFLSKRDKAGESSIDCFMAAWINGTRMGWSEPGSNFVRAAETALSSRQSIVELRKMIDSQGRKETLAHHNNHQQPQTLSWQKGGDLYMLSRVWRAFDMLCRAAARGSIDYPCDFQIVPFLATLGTCPSIFARLAINLFPEQLLRRDGRGHMPIHCWALSSISKKDDDDDEGLLGPLLCHFPETALMPAKDGQLPIHLALSNNKPLRDVQELWQASPSMLAYVDGPSGLYPFALAACAAAVELKGIVRGFHRRGPSVKLYDWLDATRDMDGAEEEASCHLLGCIYDMLRAHPQALHDSRTSVHSHNSLSPASSMDESE